MALKEFLVLRCLAQRGLEGRMALIQPLGNWITAFFAGMTRKNGPSGSNEILNRYVSPANR